jgi:hypothetical protein
MGMALQNAVYDAKHILEETASDRVLLGSRLLQ